MDLFANLMGYKNEKTINPPPGNIQSDICS